MKTIVVAMSGGVDSSTTALQLLNEGYNVISATMSMGRKCDAGAIEDARTVCDKLGIRHHVIDVSGNFKSVVVEYFIKSYLCGETPNPCAMCNRFVKFKEMIDFMKKIGADYIATGHYASIVENNGKYELHRAACIEKDQSYFLSTINHEFLQYIKFPLWNKMSKDNTRQEAKNAGLHVFNKNDSQDICFIENNDYKKFLFDNVDKTQIKSGFIRHINGRILGKHNGIINYTIGQRKGLNISYNKPIYVVRLDAVDNTVYVSDNEEDLFNDVFFVRSFNKLSDVVENYDYIIKIRSTHMGQSGKIKITDEGKVKVILNEKTRAITRGQLACVYDGSMVVGGGYIN